jgi:ADP-ribose pyrophosphatase YjhB (NUDIX family)
MSAPGLAPPISDRIYPPRPILGVGGLVFDGDRILLIKRAKDPGRGRWSIPGGAVELGETVHQALIREMDEEVGLGVRPGPLVEVVERIFRDDDELCRVVSGRPRPGSDASDVRFVEPDRWDDYQIGGLATSVLEKGLALHQERGSGPI